MAQYNELQTITRMIDRLESRIKTIETSPRLFASGIGAGGINIHDQGSIRVEGGGSVNIYDGGNLEVYGDSKTNGTITVGSGGKVVSDGPVSFSKSSTFGGNVSITGSLTVTGNITIKSGLITSNALKNQMSSSRTQRKSTNFSITGSWSTKVSATLDAPSWASKAVVYLQGDVYLENKNTNTSLRTYVRAGINGDYSKSYVPQTRGSADIYFGASAGHTYVVNNPGTISGTIQVGSGTTSSASSSNSAVVSMLAVYYR